MVWNRSLHCMTVTYLILKLIQMISHIFLIRESYERKHRQPFLTFDWFFLFLNILLFLRNMSRQSETDYSKSNYETLYFKFGSILYGMICALSLLDLITLSKRVSSSFKFNFYVYVALVFLIFFIQYFVPFIWLRYDDDQKKLLKEAEARNNSSIKENSEVQREHDSRLYNQEVSQASQTQDSARNNSSLTENSETRHQHDSLLYNQEVSEASQSQASAQNFEQQSEIPPKTDSVQKSRFRVVNIDNPNEELEIKTDDPLKEGKAELRG